MEHLGTTQFFILHDPCLGRDPYFGTLL